MKQAILIVTELASAPELAESLGSTLSIEVETAPGRKAALVALRRREYSVVILDAAIADLDPEGADLIWKHSGLAAPIEFNFAIAGGARLAREVRSALSRRAREETAALRSAARMLELELRSAVTGLLLHSQLALAEPSIPPKTAEKLRTVVELADSLRQRLSNGGKGPAAC